MWQTHQGSGRGATLGSMLEGKGERRGILSPGSVSKILWANGRRNSFCSGQDSFYLSTVCVVFGAHKVLDRHFVQGVV